MSTATLTSKGQTTIPKDIRERLRLQPGDRLEFVLQDDVAILRPATRAVTDLKGMLPQPRKALSLTDMDAALRRHAGR